MADELEGRDGADRRDAPPDPPARTAPPRHLPELPLAARVVLFAAGWLLFLIGVAGLALPGIQGIVTIILGIAVLSVASQTAHRLLHRLFSRWPRLLERIDHLRERIHRRFHR